MAHVLFAVCIGSAAILPSMADAFLAPAGAQSGPVVTSDLASDERVDFYTTAAYRAADGGHWIIPVHGRVHRPVRSSARKALIAQALGTAFDVRPDRASRMRFDERIDLLLADNKGGRRIVITLAGRDHVLPPSGEDGHVRARLSVPSGELDAEARAGRVAFSARLSPRDPRSFAGVALLLAPAGRSVISDIDDTVKITHVGDTKRMLEATLVREFEAVPGLARVYQSWASEGVAVHFVSSSPWHLYEPLVRFLREAGFPEATLSLKQIRLKDRSIKNLLADATQTKPPAIEALLAAYPRRTFVLVGDSGEKDPEIYADLLRRHPERIESVHIRNVTGARRDDVRFAPLFAGIDAGRWQLFSDASELPRTLRR